VHTPRLAGIRSTSLSFLLLSAPKKRATKEQFPLHSYTKRAERPIPSFSLRKKSHFEQFALLLFEKRATLSNSLFALLQKERFAPKKSETMNRSALFMKTNDLL